MKRFLAGLLVGLLLATATPALAGIYGQFQGYDIVKVLVNGQEVQSDVPAIKINNRTMVPLKFVSEALRAKVTWDEVNNQAQIIHRVMPPVDKAALNATIQDVTKRFLARFENMRTNLSQSSIEKDIDKMLEESSRDSNIVLSSLVNVIYAIGSTNEDLKKEGAYLFLLNQALASEYGFWDMYKMALKDRSFEAPKMQAAPMSYWYARVKTIIEKDYIK